MKTGAPVIGLNDSGGTHEDVTKEKLGGPMTHNAVSGVGHFMAPDDAECLRMIRELLGYLPQNNREDPPRCTCADPADRMDAALDSIVPPESNQPYDMKDVIHRVVEYPAVKVGLRAADERRLKPAGNIRG